MLYCFAVLYFCIVLLYCIAVLCFCIVFLYYIAVLSSCIAFLYYIAVLSSCNILLLCLMVVMLSLRPCYIILLYIYCCIVMMYCIPVVYGYFVVMFCIIFSYCNNCDIYSVCNIGSSSPSRWGDLHTHMKREASKHQLDDLLSTIRQEVQSFIDSIVQHQSSMLNHIGQSYRSTIYM